MYLGAHVSTFLISEGRHHERAAWLRAERELQQFVDGSANGFGCWARQEDLVNTFSRCLERCQRATKASLVDCSVKSQ